MRTKRKLTVLIFTLAVAFCLVGLSSAAHAEPYAMWSQFNGVILTTTPAGDVGGTGGSGCCTPVCSPEEGPIPPNATPWSVQPWSLNWRSVDWGIGGGAKVNLSNGQAGFFVHGLVLAAGPYIGTPGQYTNTNVVGTLVCNYWSIPPYTTTGISYLFDTEPVTLSPEGNAYWAGTLPTWSSANGETYCSSGNVAFLIRETTAYSWLAYGATLFINEGKHSK